MQPYTDVLFSTSGPVRNVSVTVKTYPGGAVATIYSDNGVTPAANPVITGNDGRFLFYAADGFYTITVSGAGITTATIGPILLQDYSTTTPVASKLAASTGSLLVSTIAAGAGAVARTQQSKNRDIVSVTDFYANGVSGVPVDITGVVDSTLGLQAAHDTLSAGGALYMQGSVKITAALNFSNSGITFLGANQYSSLITQATSGAKIINNTGAYNEFSDFSMAYSAAVPAAGSTALYSSGANTRVSHIIVRNCDNGFEFTTGTGQMADNFQIFNYENIGVYFHDSNDLFISKFILNAGDTVRGRLGGIRLVNKAEAFIATDGDILLGVYSMTTDGTYGIGTRPAYNNFTDVFFDSSNLGVSIDKMVETEFVSCWFSGGRSGGGFPGCVLNQTDSLTFTNTRFFNCGSHGCVVNASSARAAFLGCSFESNSVTAGAGVAHGLTIAANTSDFTVMGCKAHNGLYTGTQGWGIIVNAGTSDRYIITGNHLTGNATGSLSDGGTGTNAKVYDNDGYNPVGASVIVYGASPFTHTNGHSPETVYIYGGTVSDVASGGQTLATASPAVVHLGPNEAVTVTASVAPTMKKVVH